MTDAPQGHGIHQSNIQATDRDPIGSLVLRPDAGGPALPPFSGMAVTAFVLSLLWLGGLGSLLGVFLSAFAVKETKSGRRAGRSLAVAALIFSIMGLIVQLIVLVAAMILGNQLADQFNQISQQVGR